MVARHERGRVERYHRAMHEPSTVGHTLRAWLRIDRGGIAWVPPLRIALVVTVLYALTMQDLAVAIPLVVGAILVGVTDPSGSLALRVRGIGLAFVAVTGAAIAGSVVSEAPAVHVVVALVVAAGFGYAGAFGPRAGFAGVVGLVTFSVYAGSPEQLGAVPLTVTCVAIGGLVQLAFAVLPELLGRMEAVRTDLFLAWHGLGVAMHGSITSSYGADVAAHVAAARERAHAAGETGETLAWLDGLALSADRTRMGAIALAAAREVLDPDASAAMAAFVHAGGTVAIRIAEALHVPFAHRRIRGAVTALDRAAVVARAAVPAPWLPAIDLVHAELTGAAARAAGPRPAGSRSLGRLRAVVPPRAPAGTARRDPSRAFRRHAVRLAVTFTLATIVSVTIFAVPHAYWLPMTVAWLMKPGFGVTTTRLVARIAGTVTGLVACVLVLSFVAGAPGAIVLVAITTFIACAFVTANYALCTAGVTGVVVTVFIQAGDPLAETALLRLAGTLLGAAFTVAAVTLWRPAMSDRLADRIVDQVHALRAYADAVLGRASASGSGSAGAPAGPVSGLADTERDALIRARLATLAEVETASVELGRHRLSPTLARELAHDLVVASAIPAIADLTGDRGLLPAVHDVALADLDRIAARIGGATPSAPPAHGEGAFAAPIARAHGRLDAAGL